MNRRSYVLLALVFFLVCCVEQFVNARSGDLEGGKIMRTRVSTDALATGPFSGVDDDAIGQPGAGNGFSGANSA